MGSDLPESSGSEKPEAPDEHDGDITVQEAEPRIRIAEPPRYAVVMHNDDYTTMDFVVEVLQRFFQKTTDEAMHVMLQVHSRGSGVAGIYPHDIAETKVAQVEDLARSRGFPLKLTIEPA